VRAGVVPHPRDDLVHGGNQLVQEELAYDQHSLTTNVNNAKDKFNDD